MRGSLTQAPGRAFSRIAGRNQWPMARFGSDKFRRMSGLDKLDIDLGANVQIGLFAPRPVDLGAPIFTGSFSISGTTLTGAGAPLPGCVVDLFKFDAYETLVASTISDGSGNFAFTLGNNSGTFFARAYISGSPNRAGVTWNDIPASGSRNVYLRDPSTPDAGGSAVFRVIGSPVVRRMEQ